MTTLVSRETIAANLQDVRGRMSRAAERAGRDPAAVRLIAVTKTFPAETVIEAVRAGVRDLGENRVQEAAEKVPAVSAAGLSPTWHLIGHLQSNKVNQALRLFQVIHSVDTPELGEAIGKRAAHPVPVLLEVNVAAEPSKFGLLPDVVPGVVARLRAMAGLDVRGLMTVAPMVSDPADVRPVFRQLRALAEQLELPELSMGMTGDFEVAIEEGSTMVRVGRAIFGERSVAG